MSRLAIVVATLLAFGSTAHAETFVCKVPKEQTLSTSSKMREYNGLAERISGSTKGLSDEAFMKAMCKDPIAGYMRQQLSLALDVYPSLRSLKCPSAVIDEYKQKIEDLQFLMSSCRTAVEKSPAKKSACKPSAAVEVMTESSSKYQVVVIRNDCPVQVSFPYSITTTSIGKTTQHFTQCAPAKTTRFVAGGSRTSSLENQSLSVTGPAKECR